MARFGRASIAITIVFAFGAVPLVMDWCSASCESASSDVPACHHLQPASAMSRITSAPPPCGHDHRVIVVIAPAKPLTASTSSISALSSAMHVDKSADRFPAMTIRAGSGFGPPPATVPLALSSPLRI